MRLNDLIQNAAGEGGEGDGRGKDGGGEVEPEAHTITPAVTTQQYVTHSLAVLILTDPERHYRHHRCRLRRQ